MPDLSDLSYRAFTLSHVKPYLLLGLLSLLLFLPGIATLPVVERDEAHFAQATRQMIQTGAYFQIRFQDKTRFQKPPGINWIQALFVRSFSDADSTAIWPYRMASVLSALFSVLLLFFFARRFTGERTALLAAAFLTSALLLVLESHMAVIDTALLSAVVLMQGALWVIYTRSIQSLSVSWGWAFLFWLAMAYGFVLKGVTPLVGGLSVGTLCMFERRLDWLRGLRLVSGLLLFIGLSLVWLLFVNAAEQSNYLLQMFHKDLLPKLQGGHESHGQPPLFHLLLLPLTFWPASLFLWQGAVFACRSRETTLVRFLLAWILPVWIFFEIMPTKLPQYVLPTFPAIAVLFALAVESGRLKPPGRWLHGLQLGWGILTVGIASMFLIIPWLLLHHFLYTGLILFMLVSGMGAACVHAAWKGIYRRASVFVLLTALLVYPVTFLFFLPKLTPVWLSFRAAQLVKHQGVSEAHPLLVVGYSEPGLVFYLNTKMVSFTAFETAKTLLSADPNRLLLIEQSKALPLHDLTAFKVIGRVQGFNYSKGQWVTLLLIKNQNQEEKIHEAI